jgi:hypothetical protein
MLNRSLLLIITLACGLNASTQQRPVDSLRIYRGQLQNMYRVTWDSLRQTEKWQNAVNNYRRLSHNASAYVAYSFLVDVADAGFKHLNADNAVGGYGPLKGPAFRYGVGINIENRHRVMFDIYIISLGQTKSTKNNLSSIEFQSSSALQFNMGYDLLKSPAFNLYPYAGIALRTETLRYKQPGQINPNSTGVWDILLNDPDIYTESTRLAYQAGLAFDWAFTTPKRSGGGLMLFARFGTDQAIGTEKFKTNDIAYRPDIRIGDWMASIGLKIYRRR